MFDGIKNLWEAISNLPKLVANAFSSFFTNIGNGITNVASGISKIAANVANALSGFFSNVVEAITGLPDLILNGIKSIFVPDADYIETAFTSFTDEMKAKFNIDTSAFESLFQAEQPVEDISADYDVPGVGTLNLKFLDTSFLSSALDKFRPIIRGFIVLMIFLFNIRQLIGFFGYDAGVVAGRSEHIKSMKEEQ